MRRILIADESEASAQQGLEMRFAALRRAMQVGGAVDAEQMRGMGGDNGEIVGHEHNGGAFRQARKEFIQFDFRLRVDVGRRLIEQEQIRVRAERLCNHRALTLPAAEFGEQAAAQSAKPHRLERLCGRGTVLAGEPAEDAVTPAPQRGSFQHTDGKGRIVRHGLRHKPDAPPHPFGRLAEDAHLPVSRGQRPQQEPQQRRLAAAVGTNHGGQGMRRQGKGDVVQHFGFPVREAHIFHRDGRLFLLVCHG